MKLMGVGSQETGTSALVLRLAQAAGAKDRDLQHNADEEHRRIARELHDNASQNLVAVLMHIASLQANKALDEGTQAILSESVRLLEQSSDQIRDICYQLYPPCLDELGLTVALRRVGAAFEKQTGITTNIEITTDIGRFPTEVEIALFRVVQEALAGIHGDPNSKSAYIGARCEKSGICVTVAEQLRNGSDCIVLPSAGSGIAITRARVEDLGGTVTIRSNSRGTRVVAHMPARQSTVVAI